MQAVFEAISNTRRREILRLIWNQELSAGEIASRFDVTWPAVSQSLGVLRRAGLITVRRESTRRFYRADPAPLGPLRVALEQMWAEDLANLQRAVERR